MGIKLAGLKVATNILTGLVNAGATIAGTVDSINTNKENLTLQKDNLAYQKLLQKLIFMREDNAVRRRVRDLKAAGLSPTLAAGSSAGAGSVVSTSAPQKKSNLESYLALASVGTALAKQQQAQTEADIARQRLIQDKMDTNYYKKNGVSPIESRIGYQQLLTNILNGFFNRATSNLPISDLVKSNANANPNPPKAIGSDGSIINSKGQSITSSQAGILKQKGLYMTFLNNGFTDDVIKALDIRTRHGGSGRRF